jgi:hypothetical protein
MMPGKISITLCNFFLAIWDHLETNGFDPISKTTCEVCSANQELNLHLWFLYAWHYASIFIILPTDGTQENSKHFPCHKSYHSLKTGAGNNSNIHWNGSVELALPKKTGVQWLLEQVWERIQAVHGHMRPRFCGCRYETGKRGLSGKQRKPFEVPFHFYIHSTTSYLFSVWFLQGSENYLILIQPEGMSRKFVWVPRKPSLGDCLSQTVLLTWKRNPFKQDSLKGRKRGEIFQNAKARDAKIQQLTLCFCTSCCALWPSNSVFSLSLDLASPTLNALSQKRQFWSWLNSPLKDLYSKFTPNS